MISWIVDQIPLWVYVVFGVGFVGTMFYFFSPILVPLWNLTPRWVKISLGVLAAIGAAFVSGRNKGSRDAAEMERRRDAEAIKNRKEIDREIHNAPESAVDKRLDGWMRDK